MPGWLQRNTAMRMSLAEERVGLSTINTNIGSAVGSVKEVVELEAILSEVIAVPILETAAIAYMIGVCVACDRGVVTRLTEDTKTGLFFVRCNTGCSDCDGWKRRHAQLLRRATLSIPTLC